MSETNMGAAAMTIGAILRERTGAVISARPNDAVRAVVDLLAQNRIGAVPVLEGDAVVGIFSERDIVRLLSSYGPEALDRSIAEVMNQSPVTCDAHLAVIGALAHMTHKRLRPSPIAHGRPLRRFGSTPPLPP